MSRLPTIEETQQFQRPPEPKNPQERMLYLAVIMIVPALIVLGGFCAWMIFAAIGVSFPPEAKNVMIACLGFIFGGGIAATVKQ